MNQQQRQLISSFIKKYSTDNGTESMLDYVADANGMLGACKELFDVNGAVDHTLVDWFYQECNSYSVVPNSFAHAVSQVLAIYNGDYESHDHYATLGLPSDADADEVKSAYRRLSLQHHPDRAANNGTYDPQIFININKAYRAITEPEKCNLQNSSPEPQPDWNTTKKRTISAGQKKKLVYWGSGMVVILLVMMVVGSINVRKRAMLAGLTENRGAFIPPQEETVQAIPGKIQHTPPETIEPMGMVFKEAMETTVQVEEYVVVTSVSDIPKTEEESLPKYIESIPAPEKEQVVEVESKQVEVVELAIVQQNSVQEEEQIVLETPLQEDETIQPDSIELLTNDLAIEIPGKEQPEPKPIVQNEKNTIQAQNVAKIEKHEPEGVVIDRTLDEKNTNLEPVKAEIPQENHIVEPEDQQKLIDQFFIEYQKAYADRNIILFSRYFSPDAIENDKPFSEMIPVYTDLFESTSDILLKINVLFWKKLEKKVQVEGRFSVNLKYKKGRESSGVGTISFLLRKEEGEYKITSLAYEFD